MTTLNVKCGPMLKYDTCENGIYHAFALIVTADEGSDYSHTPSLQVSWKPTSGANGVAPAEGVTPSSSHASSTAQKIWQYTGQGGNHTFWRFKIEVPMDANSELAVSYSVDGTPHPDSDTPAVTDGDRAHTFYVPSQKQNFRWAGHSCNGFSASEDPAPWNGPDPLWDDLLNHHKSKPFHVVVGGGDQIYCDKLASEPEFKEWKAAKPKDTIAMKLTPEIEGAMDRYFFHHYCEWFGGGSFAKTIAQIPMLNMLDDHDLIDGFGTYPDDLMESPIFNTIGRKGFHYYYLFQQFVNPEIDGQEDGRHPFKSAVFGAKPAYVQYKHCSFLSYLGPKQYILLVDCRAERKVRQIVSEESYQKLFARLQAMPEGVEHLIILLGVPWAYPRMVFLERTLSSSFNPLVMLAKGISPGFTNNFNGQVELLDDLGDHWCAHTHKSERNELVERVQKLALEKHVRISTISGDVHAGGVGVFYGYHQHDPATDPKYMLAVITSAIVNAPPPPAVINMLNKLAAKKHRSLFYTGTKESMVPLFDDGKTPSKYIVGARNWCAVDYDEATHELQFDLRVEMEKGQGAKGTKGYAVRAPPPKWDIPREHHHFLHSQRWKEIMGSQSGGEGKASKSKDPVGQAIVAPSS